MNIILLNGHVGCLKTTLSYLLSSRFSLGHISTSTMGEFTSNENDENFMLLRKKRYKKAFNVAETYLKQSVSIVLDGNFPFVELRNEVYKLAEKYNVDNILSVTCICSDMKRLEERFEYRINNKSAPDSNANKISTYYGSIKSFESLNNDKFKGENISQIIFDSGSYSSQIIHSRSELTNEVNNYIQKLINDKVFLKPLFI